MSSIKSHYELDLYFYPELKVSIEARAKYHNFPEEVIASKSLTELFAMVRDHEHELKLQAERTVKEELPLFTLLFKANAKGGC